MHVQRIMYGARPRVEARMRHRTGRGVFRHQEQVWWAPYAIPWAAIPVVLLVTSLAHNSLATGMERAWTAAAVVVLSGGLLAMTWLLVRHRPVVLRVLAPVTVVVVTGWVATVLLTGPTPGAMWALLLLGAGLAVAWDIRVATRAADSEDDELFERLGLQGTKVMGARSDGPWARLHLRHVDGETTPEDVQRRRPQVAGLMKTRLSDVRVVPDRDRHDQTVVSKRLYDPLAAGIEWAGLSTPGGSIGEPLRLGGYAEGPPLRLWLPGNGEGRNATHVLVGGMNGSGKSHGARIAMVEVISRHDADLIVADPSKGKQTIGPLLPWITWPALGMRPALALVGALPNIITGRADQLGEWGYDQWVPEVYQRYGMKYLVVWIEEASRLVRNSAGLIDIAQEARSAGISLVISLQRPSSRNMTTDLRQQLGASWCFGMKDVHDAAFFLSDELLDSGADPGMWQNKHPGYCFLDAPGVPEELVSVEARTFGGSVDDLVVALRDEEIESEDLDEWTAAAAGMAYREAMGVGAPVAAVGGQRPGGVPRIGVGVDHFPGTRR